MANGRDTSISGFAEDIQDSGSTSPPLSSRRTSAAAAVFGSYELIENILLCLPLEDILLVSNICKAFRCVGERSWPIIIRFSKREGGFRKRLDLREDSIWSEYTVFAFLHEFYPEVSTFIQKSTMFLSQRGECEAMGVLYEDVNGGIRLKIADGLTTAATFRRIHRRKWEITVSDTDSGETSSDMLVPSNYPLDEDIILYYYLVRFHGEPRFGYQARR
jgi:hypothetical protein